MIFPFGKRASLKDVAVLLWSVDCSHEIEAILPSSRGVMKYLLLLLAVLVLAENLMGQGTVTRINRQIASSLPDVSSTTRSVTHPTVDGIKTSPALKIHPPESKDEVQSKPDANSASDLDPLVNSFLPHPYLRIGPSIMGGGYAVLAYRAETGFDVESRLWVMKGSAAYDDGHQVNDGDQPNPKGHDRSLESALYYRPPIEPLSGRWFVGGGWTWSQLSTTNYVHSGSRPLIGGGYDLALRPCPTCRRDFSMRVAMDWLTGGSDWQNGSHGPQITFTLPGLREQRHWFWQQRLGVYRFHDSVTDRTNVSLTREQQSKKHFDAFLDLGIMYRF